MNVVDYLIFHKALSEDNGSKINEYLDVVNGLKQNAGYSSIKNTVDREIMIIFELVMNEKLNPWDIDLVQFSTMYMKRIKNEKEIDLVTAGYLVFMAWSILKLQSDKLLENIRLAQEQQSQEEFSWDVIPDWVVGDDGHNYTSAVLQGKEVIDEKIRRKGCRRVTLLELIRAFEEAKQVSETRRVTAADMDKRRKVFLEEAIKGIDEKLHKDDLDEDMNHLWNKISKMNGNAIPLSALTNGNKMEYVETFISVLFLAEKHKIKVWQRNFPYGDIFLKKVG